MVCKEVPDEATTLSQVAQPGEMTSALDGMELRAWQDVRNVATGLTTAKWIMRAPQEHRWLLDTLEVLRA